MAKFEKCEEILVDDKTVKQKVYLSSDGHRYRLSGNVIRRNGVFYGSILQKSRNRIFTPILIFLIAALLVLAIILLLSSPVERDEPIDWTEAPVIAVNDPSGDWGEMETLAVFTGQIKPGSRGSYRFIIKNTNDFDVSYSFYMQPKNVVGEDFFPLKFMLKMNNQHIGDAAGWQSIFDLRFEEIDLLSGTAHAFTLEWEWPFESGNDEKDTEVGRNWEDVGLTVFLLANRT